MITIYFLYLSCIVHDYCTLILHQRVTVGVLDFPFMCLKGLWNQSGLKSNLSTLLLITEKCWLSNTGL